MSGRARSSTQQMVETKNGAATNIGQRHGQGHGQRHGQGHGQGQRPTYASTTVATVTGAPEDVPEHDTDTPMVSPTREASSLTSLMVAPDGGATLVDRGSRRWLLLLRTVKTHLLHRFSPCTASLLAPLATVTPAVSLMRGAGDGQTANSTARTAGTQAWQAQQAYA